MHSTIHEIVRRYLFVKVDRYEWYSGAMGWRRRDDIVFMNKGDGCIVARCFDSKGEQAASRLAS